MRLEFTYTPEDLAEAAKAIAKAPVPGRSRFQALRGIVGWGLFIGLAVMLSLWRSRSKAPSPAVKQPPLEMSETIQIVLPWALVFAVIITFGFLRFRGRYKRLLAESPELQQGQTFELDQDGVRLSNGLATTTWKWTGCVGVTETSKLLLLQTSVNSWVIIPKRAAGGDGELQNLRALLAAHVSPPTRAFPVLPVEAEPDAGHERAS